MAVLPRGEECAAGVLARRAAPLRERWTMSFFIGVFCRCAVKEHNPKKDEGVLELEKSGTEKQTTVWVLIFLSSIFLS
jgi:hypothetical protein